MEALAREVPELIDCVTVHLHVRDMCALGAASTAFYQLGRAPRCVHARAYSACMRSIRAIMIRHDIDQFDRKISMRATTRGVVTYIYGRHVSGFSSADETWSSGTYLDAVYVRADGRGIHATSSDAGVVECHHVHRNRSDESSVSRQWSKSFGREIKWMYATEMCERIYNDIASPMNVLARDHVELIWLISQYLHIRDMCALCMTSHAMHPLRDTARYSHARKYSTCMREIHAIEYDISTISINVASAHYTCSVRKVRSNVAITACGIYIRSIRGCAHSSWSSGEYIDTIRHGVDGKYTFHIIDIDVEHVTCERHTYVSPPKHADRFSHALQKSYARRFKWLAMLNMLRREDCRIGPVRSSAPCSN